MSITQAVNALGIALKKRRWKLVTAESCTGGGLAYWLTSVAGSSDWFERGLVTYSNASKHALLGVRVSTLEKFGAVSEATAREMAEGALGNSSAQLSIAITGIAGPAGGTVEKPVGTVWFAWKGVGGKTQAKMSLFSGGREAIREQAIEMALKLLQGVLEQN